MYIYIYIFIYIYIYLCAYIYVYIYIYMEGAEFTIYRANSWEFCVSIRGTAMGSSLLILSAALDSNNPDGIFAGLDLPPMEYGKIICLIYLQVNSSIFTYAGTACNSSRANIALHLPELMLCLHLFLVWWCLHVYSYRFLFVPSSRSFPAGRKRDFSGQYFHLDRWWQPSLSPSQSLRSWHLSGPLVLLMGFLSWDWRVVTTRSCRCGSGSTASFGGLCRTFSRWALLPCSTSSTFSRTRLWIWRSSTRATMSSDSRRKCNGRWWV